MAFQDFIQNPWTQFGGMLMAGGDPRGEGLGGLGRAILGTGRELRDQQRYEIEQARNQQLADIQLQTFQAQLAARQRAQNWAATQGPMAQAAPEAALQAAIEAQYRKPPGAQSTIAKLKDDLAAKRITPEEFDFLAQQEMTPGRTITPLEGGGYTTQEKGNPWVSTVIPGVPGVQQVNVNTGERRVLSGQAAAQQPAAPAVGPAVQQQAAMPPVQPAAPDAFTIHQRTQALKALPNEVRQEFTSAESTLGEIPAVIAKVEANPGAFSKMIGATYYLPEQWQGGMLSKAYSDMQKAGLTPEEQSARISVFRDASRIIRQLSGAAVSGAEKERIEGFLPKASDDGPTVIRKLNDALEVAGRTHSRISTDYNIPRLRDVTAPEVPWTERGGVKFRRVQ